MYAPRLGRSPVRPSGGISGPGGGHSTSAVDPVIETRERNGMDPSPHLRHRVPDWRCEATSHDV
jgi:hypothetical protein